MVIYLYNLISSILLTSIGLVTSVTDIKSGKIYNKHLIWFCLAGAALNIPFLLINNNYKNSANLNSFIINFIITFLVSVLFYRFKIWAAGDAKLFCLNVLLLPVDQYASQPGSLFPSFTLLVLIFGWGFIYICLETVVLIVNDIWYRRWPTRVKIREIIGRPQELVSKFSFALIMALCLNGALLLIPNTFLVENQWLRYLISLVFIFVVTQVTQRRFVNHVIALAVLLLIGLLYEVHLTERMSTSGITISSIGIATAVVFMRSMASRYNYRLMPTELISKGMILSYETISKFQKSRVHGLPALTTESTDSRLSAEEASSIKRWATSKYGENTITIVRHMPFAPFIALGTATQLVLYYTR